jgi:cytochrome c
MTGLAMPGLRLAWAAALLAAAQLSVADAAHADGDAARGEKRFEDCVACHSTERGVNNLGPSLYGVLDRKAGELADFRYSPALRRSGITWTAQALDTFIADPQHAVPANRMPYAGMPDAADRADLIAYLRKASK